MSMAPLRWPPSCEYSGRGPSQGRDAPAEAGARGFCCGADCVSVASLGGVPRRLGRLIVLGRRGMLREKFKEELKLAMKARNARPTATLRLIQAALKDRDIAARGRGKMDGIDEAEILSMLQTMIKQRRESIEHFEKGGRLELAQQEQEEIAVIEGFLPKQISDAEAEKAVKDLIAELGAVSIKDMGRTMAALRERYAGRMDFTKASVLVKQALTK
jgi:hypothetical protein